MSMQNGQVMSSPIAFWAQPGNAAAMALLGWK
jgi:hypothetical protein